MLITFRYRNSLSRRLYSLSESFVFSARGSFYPNSEGTNRPFVHYITTVAEEL